MNAEFREHVINNLSKSEKSLSSKYFYDDLGSSMFLTLETKREGIHSVILQICLSNLGLLLPTYDHLRLYTFSDLELYAKITELEHYYLTRTEEEIFETHSADFVKRHFSTPKEFGSRVNFIELGAGDGRKTKILLQALLDHGVEFEYVPIDISRQAMADLFKAMGSFFKGQSLKVHGVVGDYMDGVQQVVAANPKHRNAVLFIGSSIGNFSSDKSIEFLSQLRAKLNPKDLLLLGCDLRKETETMRKAYADPEGVTREFNINLLTRMNRELGTNFDTENFEHLAFYNPKSSAMESYLLAKKEHHVIMPANPEAESTDSSQAQRAEQVKVAYKFSFKTYESIFMEYSHKYTVESVKDILRAAGLSVMTEYMDKREWFLDVVSIVPST